MDRAHRSLLILAVITTLAAGLLAQAVAAQAGSAADVRLAGSLLLLITSSALLVRVLRRLTQPAPPRTIDRQRRSCDIANEDTGSTKPPTRSQPTPLKPRQAGDEAR